MAHVYAWAISDLCPPSTLARPRFSGQVHSLEPAFPSVNVGSVVPPEERCSGWAQHSAWSRATLNSGGFSSLLGTSNRQNQLCQEYFHWQIIVKTFYLMGTFMVFFTRLEVSRSGIG